MATQTSNAILAGAGKQTRTVKLYRPAHILLFTLGLVVSAGSAFSTGAVLGPADQWLASAYNTVTGFVSDLKLVVAISRLAETGALPNPTPVTKAEPANTSAARCAQADLAGRASSTTTAVKSPASPQRGQAVYVAAVLPAELPLSRVNLPATLAHQHPLTKREVWRRVAAEHRELRDRLRAAKQVTVKLTTDLRLDKLEQALSSISIMQLEKTDDPAPAQSIVVTELKKLPPPPAPPVVASPTR